MGWAEALILLGMPYDSEDAIVKAESLMQFLAERAHAASARLAKSRGAFPNFRESIWAKRGDEALRNATVTTVAPTGTISVIAGCSSGIEPIFAVSYFRSIVDGTLLLQESPYFRDIAQQRGFYSRDLLGEIAETGSVQKIAAVPDDVKRLFATAFDIAPEWHVKMQAAFQKHTDNAVSKTVNLPQSASVGDVRRIFRMAVEMRLKGITVYRYGSRSAQPLTFVSESSVRGGGEAVYGSEFAGPCRECQ